MTMYENNWILKNFIGKCMDSEITFNVNTEVTIAGSTVNIWLGKFHVIKRNGEVTIVDGDGRIKQDRKNEIDELPIDNLIITKFKTNCGEYDIWVTDINHQRLQVPLTNNNQHVKSRQLTPSDNAKDPLLDLPNNVVLGMSDEEKYKYRKEHGWCGCSI